MRKRGFTLVELLTVIAIIALLAALLMPTLSRAKFQAWNTKCKSNARQLGIAANLYTSTYNAYPPSSIGVPLLPTEAITARAWWDFLELPNKLALNNERQPTLEGIFRCPFQKPIKALILSGNGSVVSAKIMPLTSYAYNGWGVGLHADGLGLGGRSWIGETTLEVTPSKDSSIKSPGKLIAFGDGFQRSVFYDKDGAQTVAWEAVLSPWAHGYALYSEAFKLSPTFKAHHGKFNRVFCDGHVDAENLNGQFSPTDSYLAGWNMDDLPHRQELRN
jgi:prepilin-type N-terminal cleavage/methylation domain-containing protein